MTAWRTTPRTRPRSPFPTSIATMRTAAMSIPKRVAAPPMNASWVARVTTASERAPCVRAMKMFVPRLARTKTASPAMFCPVPDRIVSWSPNCAFGRAASIAPRRPPDGFAATGAGAGSLLEVAKAAEVLLHLLRLVGGDRGAGILRPRGTDRRTCTGRRVGSDHLGEDAAGVPDRGRRVERGQDRGSEVDEHRRLRERLDLRSGDGDHALRAVVAREPVRLLHGGLRVRE